jgi:hypothetical protein
LRSDDGLNDVGVRGSTYDRDVTRWGVETNAKKKKKKKKKRKKEKKRKKDLRKKRLRIF